MAAILSQRPDDGRVEEADLELNGVAYEWVLDGGGEGKAGLRSTVHHELGHILGLDHPCEMHVSPGSTRDQAMGICQTPEQERLLMYPGAGVTDKTVSLSKTVYLRLGDWPMLLSALTILLGAAFSRFNRGSTGAPG